MKFFRILLLFLFLNSHCIATFLVVQSKTELGRTNLEYKYPNELVTTKKILIDTGKNTIFIISLFGSIYVDYLIYYPLYLQIGYFPTAMLWSLTFSTILWYTK